MSQYVVLQNQSISDAVLNSLGDIDGWEDFISENFFSSWTPDLFSGQILQVPDSANTNVGNIAALAEYPANNFSVPDIYGQIDELFASLVGLIPIPSENVLPIPDTNVYYTVSPHATIGDVVLNATGDISNWNLVTQNMFANSWTPDVLAGQQIPIPSTINLNSNNYRALNAYPANNFSVPDIYEQIDALFALLDGDLWILRTGFWIDSPSEWIDTAHWID